MTGPAIVKILQPIPNTCPSFLYSIAGAATEFANPVIGTSVPAPPNFAVLAVDAVEAQKHAVSQSADVQHAHAQMEIGRAHV